jgi:hypothetical protein
MSIEQEIPVFFRDHRLVASLDIFNFGNLINKNWGRYTSPNFYQAYQAATVDSLTGSTSSCGLTGAAIASKYCFTGFQTPSQIASSQSTTRSASTWQIQFGIRYEF